MVIARVTGSDSGTVNSVISARSELPGFGTS